MHKDAAGQELELFDTVYFIHKEYGDPDRLVRGTVVAFTPKQVTVEYADQYADKRKSIPTTRLVKVSNHATTTG